MHASLLEKLLAKLIKRYTDIMNPSKKKNPFPSYHKILLIMYTAISDGHWPHVSDLGMQIDNSVFNKL